MFHRPSPLTINCCLIIRSLLHAEQSRLTELIHSTAIDLGVDPTECLQLIKRSENPAAAPEFDGHHVEEDWYNNNLQMPRLLVALCEQLGVAAEFPKTYRLADSSSDTLAQARVFLNGYIRRALAKLPTTP